MNDSGLVAAWRTWTPGARPYVLDADRPVMLDAKTAGAISNISSWRDAYSAPDFAAPGDTKIHLGLIPQPFGGDVMHASVYVLLLNPGLGPHDYYGEEVPEYREALLATLRQDFSPDRFPFMFLDPQFAWHGGFGWWHGKFAKLIKRMAIDGGETFADARARLAHAIASIELFPYHSAAFRERAGWLHRLESVKLAKQFVSSYVLPRVQRGEAIVIATRQTARWNLPERDGVVVYRSHEARSAHLTPDSPGGRAILKHLSH